MKRKIIYVFITGLTLALYSMTVSAYSDKLSKNVRNKMKGNGNEYVSVIVQYHDMPEVAENDRLATLEAQTNRSYGKLSPARGNDYLRFKILSFILCLKRC